LAEPTIPSDVQAHLESDASVPAFVGAPLKRRAQPLPEVVDLSASRAARSGATFIWSPTSSDDRQTGILCHAWIAQIAREGLDVWNDLRVQSLQGVIRVQLSQAGVPPTRLDGCVQAVSETIHAMLKHDKGRWILQQADSRREWEPGQRMAGDRLQDR